MPWPTSGLAPRPKAVPDEALHDPPVAGSAVDIHGYVFERSGSSVTADRYIERIDGFLSSFDILPERGTVRDDVCPGLRIVGFERSASVAFVIEDDDVVILRILAGGREFKSEE